MTVNLRRIGYPVVAVLVAVGLAFGAADTALGWLIPLAVIGGGAIGAALIALRSRTARAAYAPDSFARDGLSDVMNMAHVRVAGLGGAGLLVVAGLTALQFDLTRAVLLAGVIGGLMTGVAMILFRQRRQS